MKISDGLSVKLSWEYGRLYIIRDVSYNSGLLQFPLFAESEQVTKDCFFVAFMNHDLCSKLVIRDLLCHITFITAS